MLNNSIRLPTHRLECRRKFMRLEDDVAASVKENFRANLARLLSDLKDDSGKRVTQEQFAAKLDVKPQKVSQWKGGVFPRPEQIDEIAKALGVPSEALFRESIAVEARDLEVAVRELAGSLGFELKKKN